MRNRYEAVYSGILQREESCKGRVIRFRHLEAKDDSEAISKAKGLIGKVELFEELSDIKLISLFRYEEIELPKEIGETQ